METFTIKELDIILESLKYTLYNFENYEKYPSHEYKQHRIAEVNELIAKVSSLKKSLTDKQHS